GSDQREARTAVLLPLAATPLARAEQRGQTWNARQPVAVGLALPLRRAVAVVEGQRGAGHHGAVRDAGDPDDARGRPELGVHREVGDLPGDVLRALPAVLRADLRRGGRQVEDARSFPGEKLTDLDRPGPGEVVGSLQVQLAGDGLPARRRAAPAP